VGANGVLRQPVKSKAWLRAFRAGSSPRDELIDLRLHLGDSTELQVQVVPDVVENAAALV
jgi:hypothetical protein